MRLFSIFSRGMGRFSSPNKMYTSPRFRCLLRYCSTGVASSALGPLDQACVGAGAAMDSAKHSHLLLTLKFTSFVC